MKRFFLCFLFLVFVSVVPTVVLASDLTITAIGSANWGDSTLLESNGKYLLIDVTGGEINDVLNYLESNNISKFDLYLSHYHWDHYGRDNQMKIDNQGMSLMEYLMRTYDVGTLYLPDDTAVIDNSDVLSIKTKLVEAANDMSIGVVTLTKGSKFRFGSTSAEVLYVNKDKSIEARINNSSLVTMFTNGNTKYLNAGDIEHYTENKILEEGISISADIFKLSHHGLNYEAGNQVSNTSSFINAIKPKYSYFMHNYPNNLYKCQLSIDNLSGFSNVYMSGINGNITFVVEDDIITPIIEKNVNTLKINYVDKDTNTILDTRTYQFNAQLGEIPLNYYLYNYEKQFPDYTVSGGVSAIPQSGVLKANTEYTIYYKKNLDQIWSEYINEYQNSSTIKEYKNYGVDVDIISTYNSLKLIATNKHNEFVTTFTYNNGILTYVPLSGTQFSFEQLSNEIIMIRAVIETISNLKGYDSEKLYSWLEKNSTSLTLENDGIEMQVVECEFNLEDDAVSGTTNVDRLLLFKLDLKNGIKTFDNNYEEEKGAEPEEETEKTENKDDSEKESEKDEDEIENPKTIDSVTSVTLLSITLFGITIYSYKKSKKRA